MNILFTCAGRRNYLINYFKEALKGEGKIFAADMQLNAPALVDADIAIQVPGIYESNYIESIKEVIQTHQIDLLISLNDLELPILSNAKNDIERMGVKVVVPNQEVIDIAFDKAKTADFLKTIGLYTPKTYLQLSDALQAIEQGELNFPVVVKPRWGSASIGIEFPKNREELELVFELAHLRLKDTILAEASKEDLAQAILIQEKIEGPEYGMDVLNDFEGNYQGTFVRKKLAMRSGETDKAISVIDHRFETIGCTIGENLKHIGNLDCDVLEKDGKLYVLELNARFGGGYPFSHEAGMNTAAAYLSWMKGEKGINRFNNYKAGLSFSKCDRLMKI